MKGIWMMVCVLLSASLLFAGGIAAITQVDGGAGNAAQMAVQPRPDAYACSNGYSRVSIGEEITSGAYRVRLNDLSVSVGAGNSHPAILDVRDQNGAVLDSIQVMPGSTYIYSGPSGKIAISVCQTAPGFTLNAKWAKIKAVATTGAPTNACQGLSAVTVGYSTAFAGGSVVLSDISVSTGQDNVHSAIVDVLDSSGATVAQKQIAPGESKVVQVGTQNIKITACQTAPGFTLDSKWAKISAVPTNETVTPDCANAPFNATKQGIVEVGGELDSGAYKVRLADISVENDVGKRHMAIVDILDANDVVQDSASIAPGTAYTFTGNGGAPLNIYICQTAPGYLLNAKWADIRMG